MLLHIRIEWLFLRNSWN